MNQSKHIKEELVDKIIAAAYGDAGILDKIIVGFQAVRNPEVKKLLKDYKETADAVHSLLQAECPDALVKATGDRIKYQSKYEKKKSPVSFLRRPVFKFAAAALVIGVVSFLLIQKPKHEAKYSKAEAELAEKQVKESLAIVGKVLRKTQYKVTDEVLGGQVSPPIKKSINLINDLFKGG